MHIQSIILGLLQQRPMSGYELKQEFDRSLAYFSGASFGSIYPILRKLERQGMVRRHVKIQDARPNKKIYSITAQGKREFHQAISAPLTISSYRNEFLMRLFFYSSLTLDEQKKYAAEYISYLQGKLRALESMRPYVDGAADDYQTMCYRFGIRHIRSLLKNTGRLTSELNERKTGHARIRSRR